MFFFWPLAQAFSTGFSILINILILVDPGILHYALVLLWVRSWQGMTTSSSHLLDLSLCIWVNLSMILAKHSNILKNFILTAMCLLWLANIIFLLLVKNDVWQYLCLLSCVYQQHVLFHGWMSECCSQTNNAIITHLMQLWQWNPKQRHSAS